MGTPIIIKKLEAADIDKVSGFSMADAEDRPLRDFLRRKAMKSANAQLTRTYVAKEKDAVEVLAYISIMCAEVKLETAYQIQDKADANRYEHHPAIRIARLACCDDAKGKGLGRALVETILGVVLHSIVPNAGCRFIILDAKRKSIKFYEKHGFRLLDTQANKDAQNPIMFLDLRGRDLEEAA